MTGKNYFLLSLSQYERAFNDKDHGIFPLSLSGNEPKASFTSNEKQSPFDVLHWVPLTMNLPTTSRFLCIKITDNNSVKFSYNEHCLQRSTSVFYLLQAGLTAINARQFADGGATFDTVGMPCYYLIVFAYFTDLCTYLGRLGESASHHFDLAAR